MRNKLLKLSKFLKENGFHKLAGEVENFMEKGGNPLKKLTEHIAKEALKEQQRGGPEGNYMIGEGLIPDIYIRLINYLGTYKEKYDFVITHHLTKPESIINDLMIAKITLEHSKNIIGSEQKPIEGLEGPEAEFDKKLKGNKKEKMKYIDNLIKVFDFLINLKERNLSAEDFSKEVEGIKETFDDDTKVEEEKSDLLSRIRKRRDEVRTRGRSGTLVPPPPTFEVLEGGKKDEDEEWRELAETEMPDMGDMPEHWGHVTPDDEAQHSLRHGKNYDPETHLYDPEEYPPGFFDD